MPVPLGIFGSSTTIPCCTSITRQFAALPSGDRIAVLDDQWALVESGAQPLASYLGLVAAVGTDTNERVWTQIADALGTIEYDERGTPGACGVCRLRPHGAETGV